MFATAGSQFMTFQELMNCLKTFNFNLTQPEKLSLMKKMDENGDNQISKEEFLTALISASSTTPLSFKGSGGASPTRMEKGGDEDDRRVDQALSKIKQGAARFKSLSDYCMDLMRKLDKNKDGMISFVELSDGLREIGIKIFKGE
jgi:Ca2+-binding EF-hand superfamily protein